VLEHVAGIMALLLSAGTSRAEEGAYSNLDRLGNALHCASWTARHDTEHYLNGVHMLYSCRGETLAR